METLKIQLGSVDGLLITFPENPTSPTMGRKALFTLQPSEQHPFITTLYMEVLTITF